MPASRNGFPVSLALIVLASSVAGRLNDPKVTMALLDASSTLADAEKLEAIAHAENATDPEMAKSDERAAAGLKAVAKKEVQNSSEAKKVLKKTVALVDASSTLADAEKLEAIAHAENATDPEMAKSDERAAAGLKAVAKTEAGKSTEAKKTMKKTVALVETSSTLADAEKLEAIAHAENATDPEMAKSDERAAAGLKAVAKNEARNSTEAKKTSKKTVALVDASSTLADAEKLEAIAHAENATDPEMAKSDERAAAGLKAVAKKEVQNSTDAKKTLKKTVAFLDASSTLADAEKLEAIAHAENATDPEMAKSDERAAAGLKVVAKKEAQNSTGAKQTKKTVALVDASSTLADAEKLEAIAHAENATNPEMAKSDERAAAGLKAVAKNEARNSTEAKMPLISVAKKSEVAQ